MAESDRSAKKPRKNARPRRKWTYTPEDAMVELVARANFARVQWCQEHFSGAPSCLYVKKSDLEDINAEFNDSCLRTAAGKTADERRLDQVKAAIGARLSELAVPVAQSVLNK